MISVCLTTYNGELYIAQQLQSILKQLSPVDEIIISDDSSTDNTLNIIKGLNDSRIKLLENNTFHSPIYNLENALKNAKGDFIFLSDQDDIWNDCKVEITMNYFKDADLIISDALIIDKNGIVSHESFFELNKTKQGKIYNLIKNGYLGCCMAFKKTMLDFVLPFPINLPMHDIWIGNVISFNKGKIKFIDEKLISYRRHDNNVSITSEKSNRSVFTRVRDRLIIILNIIKRLK